MCTFIILPSSLRSTFVNKLYPYMDNTMHGTRAQTQYLMYLSRFSFFFFYIFIFYLRTSVRAHVVVIYAYNIICVYIYGLFRNRCLEQFPGEYDQFEMIKLRFTASGSAGYVHILQGVTVFHKSLAAPSAYSRSHYPALLRTLYSFTILLLLLPLLIVTDVFSP